MYKLSDNPQVQKEKLVLYCFGFFRLKSLWRYAGGGGSIYLSFQIIILLKQN